MGPGYKKIIKSIISRAVDKGRGSANLHHLSIIYMYLELPFIRAEARPEDKGQRLDQFLTKRLGFSRAQVGKLIREERVLGPGLVKPSRAILGHEIFEVCLKREPSPLMPEAIPLDILYSDDHIAVINKPVGLVVHPGAQAKSGTLCHALLYHFPKLLEANSDRPGIVHRLDKDTSGVMVVAKTVSALTGLSAHFKERRVKKIYRALAWGEFDQSRFELKTGHMRHPYNRLRFFTKIEPPKVQLAHVRFAHTSFEVLKHGQGISELLVTLHTGRTHQIRAHLSDIDHPLLGDALYGGKREISRTASDGLKNALSSLNTQALHAERLEFCHPITDMPLCFCAPLPKAMAEISRCL